MLPKTFTNETLNAIACYRSFYVFARYCQAKSRRPLLGILPEYNKIFITGTLGKSKHTLEFATFSQALCAGEAVAGYRNLKVPVNARSDCQALATFGTAATQYFATVSGAHAGTEAVGTFTFNLTGLKSSFHGRYRALILLSQSKTPDGVGKGGKVTVLPLLCQSNWRKTLRKQ